MNVVSQSLSSNFKLNRISSSYHSNSNSSSSSSFFFSGNIINWKSATRKGKGKGKGERKGERKGRTFCCRCCSPLSLTSNHHHPFNIISQQQQQQQPNKGMEGAAPSLYPLHRCKTLHLVRHGQGYHNVAGEKDHSSYMSLEYFDASLTPLGWEQVHKLQKHVHAHGLASRIELVVTSPLMRTMQTAVGVFGGDQYVDGEASLPLMVSNTGNSNQNAISSLNCPPFAAVELCREHLGVHPCDRRRSINEYRPLFPAIDFSLIESDEDSLWKADSREEIDEVAARGKKFIDWVWTRPEKEIAVVTHSGFLVHTLRHFAKEYQPIVKEEISKPFANCELRSFVILDKSLASPDQPSTNVPGKVPQGPDVPSDHKHMENNSNSHTNHSL